MPKGGGAIRDIGEKFRTNLVTGTGSMSIPVVVSPGRSSLGPNIVLSYDSGAGNGPFGVGWNLPIPSVTRKTDKGLPEYRDADESDVFILSDAEDLVPKLHPIDNDWLPEKFFAMLNGVSYAVQRYCPRVEGSFARIERWCHSSSGISFWKTISRDNLTSLYGTTEDSRIYDPDAPFHIFKWLLERSYDDKGNLIIYEYKTEDRLGIPDVAHESNRKIGSNRYLKRIKYGNRAPYYPNPQAPQPTPLPEQWLFQVVFDYGEHDTSIPRIGEDVAWPARQDTFSNYRAGFEVRTARLCRRVLMFHQFAELGPTPCLIRSTDFSYDAGPAATFLTAACQTSYLRNPQDQSYHVIDPVTQQTLSPRALPAVEFSYAKAVVDQTLRSVAAEALDNLPFGADGTRYQWLDLDGEGSPGILTEQATGWFYKRNVSNLLRDATGVVVAEGSAGSDNRGTVLAHFDPAQLVASKPSLAALANGRLQFMDLAGEGQQCLVEFDGPVAGFYQRKQEDDWHSFTPFESMPGIDWNDPDLKYIDINGDGFADLLISENEVFTWYPSLGKFGFGSPERVRRPFDEDRGPVAVFDDATQSIFLADFSGDGLTDIVRIRNGEICYWPNLGYGRFGAKVIMSSAPLFDTSEQFDQTRLRLADIDGSGTTDLIYLGRDHAKLYFNQSGNRWSQPHELTQFPAQDNQATVTAIDLLGNGTTCLVWSSPLPGEAGRQMRYVDLMGGQKPHLLIATKNNLGAETRVQYAASTKFYLQDRLAGKPWITRLPFPVHVVEQVEIYDVISQNRFTSRYQYHHGYFDGVEREFRGFGMVEQLDTEAFATLAQTPALNIDQASHVPPVLTRTWHHTGAYLDGTRLSLQYKEQYYSEPGQNEAERDAMLLPDTVLPLAISLLDGSEMPWKLTAHEEREACRSLKGVVLRQEVYALDGTQQEPHPYIVSEINRTLRLLQPCGSNRHAVFLSHPREVVDYHYERKLYNVNGQQLADPRVTHAMTLAADAYGNALQSAGVAYGRRYAATDPLLTQSDRDKQKLTHVVVTENRYTNAIQSPDAYRTPLLCETLSYEMVKVSPQANAARTTNLFRLQEMLDQVQAAGDGLHDVAYEDTDATAATADVPYRRVIETTRSLFRKDNLSGPLPLGEIEALAIGYESYKLAFTPGLLAVFDGKISAGAATALLIGEGKYRDLDGDGRLWIPSGLTFFSTDPANPDPVFARNHFYLPHCAQDPFGNLSSVAYDGYDFAVAQTTDSLGNSVFAEHDYRVLQPAKMTDLNGNRTETAFDAHGRVTAGAVMGKAQEPDGKPKGDTLEGFIPDLSEAQISAFFNDPYGHAAAILGQATTRIVYDMERFKTSGQPIRAATLMRETHTQDLSPGELSKMQINITYSDGFGREIQKKVQAEPGQIDNAGPIVNQRWAGSGWVIFNNKGKPIKQYEPFFSATHDFEFAIQRGVGSTLLYDPLSRIVATLHSNHTYEKILFDPWMQQNWDVNDTVTLDPAADPDVSSYFLRLEQDEYYPTWHALRTNALYAAQAAQRWPNPKLRNAETAAANKAAAHANTPAISHVDTLGRTFLTIADNGAQGQYAGRVELDSEGNQRSVSDALGRKVMTYDYDMLGGKLYQNSMDAGARWVLNNVAGKPMRAWDSRDHQVRHTYDELLRPTQLLVRTGAGPEVLVEKNVYSESLPNAMALNLRGKMYQQYDGAGVATNNHYDFKGNLLSGSRRLLQDYKTQADWSQSPALETETFASSTTYDALNRPIQTVAPHSDAANAKFNIIQSTYNEANLLDKIDLWLQQVNTPQSLLDAATADFHTVSNIDYNAKGQRDSITYGNGTRTRYSYDDQTFRLINLQTLRISDSTVLQDLYYSYDAVGNVIHIQDDADIQNVVYFKNQRVEPSADYEYDAIYRLVQARGREHLGSATPAGASDVPHIGLLHPGDGNAMGRYVQQYLYDAVGNILETRHRGTDPAQSGWKRCYQYALDSNRLLSTGSPNDPNNPDSACPIHYAAQPVFAEQYEYDIHGNMINMPHLNQMDWDCKDQLHHADLGGGGDAYYVYDAAGQRARKVLQRQTGSRQQERIYLGGFEVHREYDSAGAAITLERETLHVLDDKQRIALVETRTQGQDGSAQQLIRFQFSNHLGSASLELDEQGAIISYEEYYPYGSSSYQAGRSGVEVRLKRYRYTGHGTR